VNPALNADLDPTGRPLRLPDCPGRQGFKLGYASIVTHCYFGKLCGSSARPRPGAPRRHTLEQPGQWAPV